MGLHERLVELEQQPALDPAVDAVARAIPDALTRGPLHDQLAGHGLGHTLHPLLTDVPLGFWMGATALDLFLPREGERAAKMLTTMGVVAAVPTAITGLVEWYHADRPRRRIATLHALVNTGGLALYTGSLLAKRREHHRTAATLAVFGGALAAAGGYLGGHLSFGRGVGVDVHARRPPAGHG